MNASTTYLPLETGMDLENDIALVIGMNSEERSILADKLMAVMYDIPPEEITPRIQLVIDSSDLVKEALEETLEWVHEGCTWDDISLKMATLTKEKITTK